MHYLILLISILIIAPPAISKEKVKWKYDIKNEKTLGYHPSMRGLKIQFKKDLNQQQLKQLKMKLFKIQQENESGISKIHSNFTLSKPFQLMIVYDSSLVNKKKLLELISTNSEKKNGIKQYRDEKLNTYIKKDLEKGLSPGSNCCLN